MMRRNFYVSLLALALSALALVIPANAQQTRSGAQRSSAANAGAVVPLPESDGVMFVDMRRLLTEAMPQVLAGNPTKLAEVNADIEQFKQRTGIDPRSFDRLAVGVRFTNPSADVTKIDHIVAIANGTFNPGVLAAAGRIAAKGKYQETKHGGKTVYVFNLAEQIKMFGILKMRVGELAMSVLDANTLVVGEPAGVRAAIDANAGRGRINPEIVALARRNPNAIVGFGANMPQSLVGKVEEFGSDEVARSVASIRQLYGSLGTSATPSGYESLLVMKTATADDARSLGNVVEALKPMASFAAAQLTGDKGKLVQKLAQSLKVQTEGNEVLLRLDFAQTDVAMMLRVF
ncbi:MAG TPA: hypothetical protein VF666_16535 [Pyrinomonadaceae bacterium]|jgi:hypothetical protein